MLSKHFFTESFITQEVIPALLLSHPTTAPLFYELGLTPKQIYNTLLFQCKRLGFPEGISHGNGHTRLTIDGDFNKILNGLQGSEIDCFKRLGEIIELAAIMYEDEDY